MKRKGGSRLPATAAGPTPAAPPAEPPSTRRASWHGPWPIDLALLGSLLLLLTHAWSYRFLTDDAFISFRYARNLSRGFGLVFNPGMERVEGYSNFLWVVFLAALDQLGLRPEIAAHALSLGATVALWAIVAWFARRTLRPGGEWWVVVPVLLLAITRSVAVWSTSGLETRWFELCVVAAALRLVVEVERQSSGRPAGQPLAAWLLALASLTRPDGLLLSAMAFASAGFWLHLRGRLDPLRMLARWLPWVALVGAHFAFRRIYYHEWLPNTYYAKVGGQLWWSSGAAYFAAFALEYAAYLWAPLVAVAIVFHARRGTGFVPLLFAALVLPHALYVAAVGGDHFEYRPIDLYFPFAFLLVADGAGALARGRALALAAAYLFAIAVGLWELPFRSHREFPDRYLAGFPGLPLESRYEAGDYLAPERDPIYRWPPLDRIAAAHRDLLRGLSSHFVGLRQEEHRLFLAGATDQARRIERQIARGLLGSDIHVALSCVGAIPYYTDLRTLDRLGLTDSHVAHSAFVLKGMMAHSKYATFGYARERGVDLWAVDQVGLVFPVTSKQMLRAVRGAITDGDSTWGAYVGDGDYLVCQLPQGIENVARRMPKLRFQPANDPEFVTAFVTQGIAAFRDSLQRNPGDSRAAQRLGYLLLVGGEFEEALELYRSIAPALAGDPDVLENMALASEMLGDSASALGPLRAALAIVEASGDTSGVRRLEGKLAALQRNGAQGRAERRP